MAKYFHISQGMRGAYMPDNFYVVKVESRRELKSIIESEAESIRDAGYYGANKREVVATVTDAWRNTKAKVKSPYPFVVPYGMSRGSYRPYGIMIAHSSRAEYLEYMENEQ